MVIRQKALVGKLKKFPAGIQRIFAMSTSFSSPDKGSLFFYPYKTQENDQSEENKTDRPSSTVSTVHALSQTYPQWKVMLDFQKLYSFEKRKQFKKRKIYILPMGNSHHETMKCRDAECKPNDINCLTSWLFDAILGLASLFFFGMDVELLEFLNIEQLGFETRIHHRTNKEQVLVGDMLDYLKRIKPKDCFCIVGWSWLDLYPSPDLNFVLGQACFDSGCAVISFGHYSAVKPNTSFDTLRCEKEVPLLYENPVTHCTSITSSSNEASVCFANLLECSPVEESCLSGLTLDNGVLWRVIKVLTHEVCHLLGMHHCTFFACLMNESTNVYEAEKQPFFLCPVCLRKLQKFLQFSVLTRYHAIKGYMEQHILRVLSDTSLSLHSQDSLGELACTVAKDDCKVINKELFDSSRISMLHKFEDCVTWLENVLIYINSYGL